MSQNDQMELTDLERQVLKTALEGLDALRLQAETAGVISRTSSGVGFVTKLRISPESEFAGDAAASRVPVLAATHPALPGGAEFLIQVKNGRLNCIEAFCFEGMWPADEALFRLWKRLVA